MKNTILFLSILISACFVSCGSDSDPIKEEEPTVLIVDAFVKDKLSSGNIVEKKIECFYQLYDASSASFDDSKQILSDLLTGYAITTDGKSLKYKYLYNEKDGRLCENIEPGKYFIVIIQEKTSRYTTKTIICDKSKTTELKKIFNNTLPRFEREDW